MNKPSCRVDRGTGAHDQEHFTTAAGCFRLVPDIPIKSFSEPDHMWSQGSTTACTGTMSGWIVHVDWFGVSALSVASIVGDVTVHLDRVNASGPLQKVVGVLRHLRDICSRCKRTVSSIRFGAGNLETSLAVPSHHKFRIFVESFG